MYLKVGELGDQGWKEGKRVKTVPQMQPRAYCGTQGEGRNQVMAALSVALSIPSRKISIFYGVTQ